MHPNLTLHLSQLWLLWTVLFSSSTRAEPAFPATFALAALDATSGFRLDGEKAGDVSGISVSHAGDINGDGVDDLIVGALFADPNGQIDAGSSYVIYGRLGGFPHPLSLSGLNATTGFRLDGEKAGDFSGTSVSRAGDINGDGVDDLIVGAQQASPNGQAKAGSSYVIYGRLGGHSHPLSLSELNATTGFRLDGEEARDLSGISVSFAGDINGDGVDDLIVGAYQASPNGQAKAGSSYVIYGRLGGYPHPFSLSGLNSSTGFRLDGEKAGDFSGRSVSHAGDINGDSLDDLIVGAPSAGPNGQLLAGSSYVIYGRLGGYPHPYSLSELNATTGFRLDGEAGDVSGTSVSHAGDINGDGVDDLIVGARQASTNGAGSSVVIYGRLGGYPHPFSFSGLNATTGFRLDGEKAGDVSGTSVSHAGDINDDGVDDLIVGAYQASPNGQIGAGSSYVIYGRLGGLPNPFSLSGLDATTGFRLDGEEAGDFSGYSVSHAGDINGDGVDDLIIGAYQASPNGQAKAGSSYVIYGRNNNPPRPTSSQPIAITMQPQVSTNNVPTNTNTESVSASKGVSSTLVATSTAQSGLSGFATSRPSSNADEVTSLSSAYRTDSDTLSALKAASPSPALNPGLIAGAAAGGIALLGSAAALGVFACRRRTTPSADNEAAASTSLSSLPASASAPRENIYAVIQTKQPEGHYRNPTALPDAGAHYLSESDAAEVLREGAQYAEFASARNEQIRVQDERLRAQGYDDISVLSGPR